MPSRLAAWAAGLRFVLVGLGAAHSDVAATPIQEREPYGGETPLATALNARAPARLTRSLTDYSATRTADLLRALGATE